MMHIFVHGARLRWLFGLLLVFALGFSFPGGTSGTTQAITQDEIRVTPLVNVTVTGTAYTGSTAAVNPQDASYGTYTIQALLTNTSNQTLQAPMYWVVRQINKLPAVPNDSRPYLLDSRDAGTPADRNARQSVPGPLAAGSSIPVQFRIAVDRTNRAAFSFACDFYAATKSSTVAKPVGTFAFTSERGPENRVQGSGFRVQGESLGSPESLGSLESPAEPRPSGRALLEPKTQNVAAEPLQSLKFQFIGGEGPQAGVRAAIDPKNPRRMAVVANDYARGNVELKYTDDATNWRQLTLSRTVNGKTYQTAFEPSVGFSQNGSLWCAYALADLDTNAAAIVVAQKLLTRLTFSPSVALTTVGAGDLVAVGRPVIALNGAQPFVAWEEQSAAGMENRIQLYDLAAQRKVEIAAGKVSHPTLTVTANGGIVVGWNDAGASKLMCRFGETSAGLGAPVVISITSLGYGRNIPAMADVAATPSLTIAADMTRPGLLYATFADFTTSMDVWFTRSTNNGQSWSTPQPVSSTTTGDQFLPSLTVDATGNLVVGFYDTRHEGNGETAHVYARRSNDGGNSLEPEIQVTDTASNTSVSNPNRTWAANYGEQMGLISRGKDGMLVFWTDTRSGSEDIFYGVK